MCVYKMDSSIPRSPKVSNVVGIESPNTKRKRKLIQINVNRRNQILISVCAFVSLFLLVTILGLLGYIGIAAKHVSSWGFAAHIVIIVFMIFVNQPFGYGYWISLTAFGYALGWSCIPSAYIGFILGSMVAFFFTKHVANDFVSRKVEHILETKKLSINLVAETIRQNKASKYSLYVSIRHLIFSTVGFNNSLLTLVLLQVDEKIAFRVYCIVSFVSEIPFIIAVVSLGNSIDQIEQGQSNSLSEILLVVQIVLTLAVMGIIIYISKKSYRMIKDKSDDLNADDIMDDGNNDNNNNDTNDNETSESKMKNQEKGQEQQLKDGDDSEV